MTKIFIGMMFPTNIPSQFLGLGSGKIFSFSLREVEGGSTSRSGGGSTSRVGGGSSSQSESKFSKFYIRAAMFFKE